MDKISVAICTRNRARLLEGALESLSRAHPPAHMAWEVVVILNDCTDCSLDVVDRFGSRLPLVSAIEPEPGLSRARNRAIDVASGNVIIWIDDDVLLAPDWLRSYEAAFLRWPQASLFGGPIIPEFEGGAPPWLAQTLHLCDAAFAARPVPAPDAPIRAEDYDKPYGANFAVRTPVQRRFRYDVRLGKRPGGMIVTGEETEVIRNILLDGGSGRWVDSAVVRHLMPRERQTIAYLRAYFEGHGWMAGRSTRRANIDPSLIERLRDRGGVLAAELRFLCLRAIAQPERWMPALIEAAAARGRWLGRYGPVDDDPL